MEISIVIRATLLATAMATDFPIQKTRTIQIIQIQIIPTIRVQTEITLEIIPRSKTIVRSFRDQKAISVVRPMATAMTMATESQTKTIAVQLVREKLKILAVQMYRPILMATVSMMTMTAVRRFVAFPNGRAVQILQPMTISHKIFVS